MSASDKPLTLSVTISPKSAEKRERLLSLLSNSLFRNPSTNCTSWVYLTPATRKGALKGLLPPSPVPVILGFEFYNSKSSLGLVHNSPEIKDFFAQVEREDLYAKPEDQTVWYPTAGFVARGTSGETGPAGLVVLAKFVVKDGAGNKDKFLEILGNFCNWVRDNEPGTQSYAVLTRPKAPNELIMFERYKDLAAIGVHGKSKEFKNMFKSTAPYVEGKLTKLEEFEELDGSFVSNIPGGGKSSAKL